MNTLKNELLESLRALQQLTIDYCTYWQQKANTFPQNLNASETEQILEMLITGRECIDYSLNTISNHASLCSSLKVETDNQELNTAIQSFEELRNQLLNRIYKR
jgi:hypothetical protein